MPAVLEADSLCRTDRPFGPDSLIEVVAVRGVWMPRPPWFDCGIMSRMRFESVNEAASHLAELAEEVETTRARVVLTRPGHADVVLLSVDELVSLEETVALADDPRAQREIAEAESAYAAGDYLTGDELRARYGLPPRVA